MIKKSFELKKINLKNNNIFLFYGKNEGLKNSATEYLSKNIIKPLIYEEKEVLENSTNFLENIFTKSLFENKKFIIIKRATDKIIKIINELKNRDIEDITILFNSEDLEKKSKLRAIFEKNKDYICIPFYPDNFQTLSKLTLSFLKENNISTSSANISLIVEKCNGHRQNLMSELEKIKYYCKHGKKITTDNINKLSNLTENYNISELVDNCLAKNPKKMLKILNENNFSNEECIQITRTLLNKLKKVLVLCNNYQDNKNIDQIISEAKPPIFWKDKEITKIQILSWKQKQIKELIFKISEIELLLKKNFNNQINLVTDFLIKVSLQTSNN